MTLSISIPDTNNPKQIKRRPQQNERVGPRIARLCVNESNHTECPHPGGKTRFLSDDARHECCPCFSLRSFFVESVLHENTVDPQSVSRSSFFVVQKATTKGIIDFFQTRLSAGLCMFRVSASLVRVASRAFSESRASLRRRRKNRFLDGLLTSERRTNEKCTSSRVSAEGWPG
jgi:hypothetical protein